MLRIRRASRHSRIITTSGGPATNPDVNIPNMLKAGSDGQGADRLADMAAASAAVKMGVRVRMTEGNTCYRGGKPGVSDVFAAALWAADYSLLLASNNYSGINLHGGTVLASPSGELHRRWSCPRRRHAPGTGGQKQRSKSPRIPTRFTPRSQHSDQTTTCSPLPMALSSPAHLSAAERSLTPISTCAPSAKPGVNATAYAAQFDRGRVSIIILNKDAENDLALRMDFGGDKAGAVEIETSSRPVCSKAAKLAFLSRLNGNLSKTESSQFSSVMRKAEVPRERPTGNQKLIRPQWGDQVFSPDFPLPTASAFGHSVGL